MQTIYHDISEELNIPKDKVEFVCEQYFKGIKNEMSNPTSFEIIIPKFGKFKLRDKEINFKIINLIKKLRNNYNTRSKNSLSSLWKIRQIIIKHYNEKSNR